MNTNLLAPAVRAARTIAALAAALTLVVLLAQSLAAALSDKELDAYGDFWRAYCKAQGGSPSIEHEVNDNGYLVGIKVTCRGIPTKGGLRNWTCTAEISGHRSCWTGVTRPEEPPYGEVPGGGTNAPATEDDPRTGDIVIVGTGTNVQDGGFVFADGAQPAAGQIMTVDTVEDEEPTTVEPDETEVVAEDDEITTVEYRRIRGGNEEQP